MKKLKFVLCALCLALSATAVSAEKKLSVLAIGNSYTQSLMPEFPKVADAAGCRLDLAIFAIGGKSLSNHWMNCEAALADPSKRPYLVNGRQTNLPEMLAEKTWDVITLQEQSADGMFAEKFDPWADRLIAYIRSKQPKAVLYFQLTWSDTVASYRITSDAVVGSLNLTQDGMYEALRKNYTYQAARFGAKLIPVGTALQLYRRDLPVTLSKPTEQALAALKDGEVPDLKGELSGWWEWSKGKPYHHDHGVYKLRQDFHHLNKEGKYLQACVWTAALFGVDLTDLPYAPDLGEDFARRAPFIRQCAMRACRGGVEIDFGVDAGRVKALHGVNNSPVRVVHPNGWTAAPQGQCEFAAAGIPYVRLHDTAGSFGGTHYVDIPNIFPNFDADENDPKSYDFAFTDAYLKPLVKAGATPFYRLGVTIETNCGLKPYNILPPKDFAKWARICEHVIRHYNEGWADGFRWNLKYWEIWNEPEGHSCWFGTQAQFFELYRTAATYLKEKFPAIRIGGYGSIGFYAVDQPDNRLWGVKGTHNTTKWAEEFISYMAEKKVPLDFFSWHIYVRNGYGPDRIGVHARYARALLDKYGYTATENFLDEWNVIEDVNMTGYKDKDWDGLKEMKSGASVAAAFAVMQNAPLDLAMYYDAMPTRKYCGLFYWPSERTTPCYETFLAFNELYRLGKAVKAVSAEKDVYVLAATDGKVQKFYLVNISQTESKKVALAVAGAEGEFSMRILDGTHPKLAASGVWKAGDPVTLPPTSLVLFARP